MQRARCNGRDRLSTFLRENRAPLNLGQHYIPIFRIDSRLGAFLLDDAKIKDQVTVRLQAMRVAKRNAFLKHPLSLAKRSSVRRERTDKAYRQEVRYPSRATPPTSITASSTTVPSTALMVDMMSSKNLDLCLLAICSCVLSLLCHQPAGISAPQAAHFPTSGTSPAATPVRVDFLIKAGLVTTRQQEPEVEQDDDLA